MSVHRGLLTVIMKPYATIPSDHIPVLVKQDLQEMESFAKVI
jgi:hypothetical protein